MTTTNNDAAGGQQPKLQIVPLSELPADEQVLLAAYRAMDGRARRQTVRVALRFAEEYQRPAPRQPLRLVVGGLA